MALPRQPGPDRSDDAGVLAAEIEDHEVGERQPQRFRVEGNLLTATGAMPQLVRHGRGKGARAGPGASTRDRSGAERPPMRAITALVSRRCRIMKRPVEVRALLRLRLLAAAVREILAEAALEGRVQRGPRPAFRGPGRRIRASPQREISPLLASRRKSPGSRMACELPERNTLARWGRAASCA